MKIKLLEHDPTPKLDDMLSFVRRYRIIVQYFQTYTDRDDGEILTYDPYSSHREMVSRIVRTVRTENGFTDRKVRETDLRIVSRVSL